MRVARCALWTFVSYGLLTTGVACADGWSMSSLLPSGNKNSQSTAKKKSTVKSSSTKRPAAKPSVVGSMTAAPKKLYSSAKALVTPGIKPSAAAKNRQNVKRSSSGSAQASNQKPSGIKSWFVPERPPLPRTVGEWMAQKRIDP